MPSWTPDHCMILSILLDAMVGTPKTIETRLDYCKIMDILASIYLQQNVYFTGSKSEGLDLPDSDRDYMHDMNNLLHIKVTQSLNDSLGVFPYSTFFMSIDNVPPGFARLQLVHQTMMHPLLCQSSQYSDGVQYLSSELFMQNLLLLYKRALSLGQTVKRQGPSIEVWTPFSGKSGIDSVSSIHCAFWPNVASEWVQRPRHFCWPTSNDISSITNFGFHLVPVGHQHSETKETEWRISFSLAERTLVWSFNHVQLQCYAVMKIILKEFIKVKCNPQNQILCSYFIKTFLFWKYESTELNFWRTDNFRECIMYLLTEFSKCLHEGVLRHFFIPRFDLLSIKLTPAAQTELLQLFNIIIQSDIGILKKCRTLRGIWSEFTAQVPENRNNLISNLKRGNLLRNDEYIMLMASELVMRAAEFFRQGQSNNAITQISALSCKTDIKTLTIRKCLQDKQRSSFIHKCAPGNKDMFRLYKTAQNDTLSYDKSTYKLWCAILFFMKGFTLPALDIVNQVLSSIPPYAMYHSLINRASNEAKQLYIDMFLDSDITMIQRSTKAWMFDLILTQDMTDIVPLALQIELYFTGKIVNTVWLSPFTCAYYLKFLCYHRMQQYDNRDHALQQLVEMLNNTEQCGNRPYNSYNITGHCLLLAGRRVQARDMFNMSYEITQRNPPYDKYNSALWYLMKCF